MKRIKTVLITGGTSDIGREIAITYAKNGWNVLLHYHLLKTGAENIKITLRDYGVSCQLLKADLSSESELYKLISKLKRIEIDSLINNAGTYTVSKHFSKLTIRDVVTTFMVNTFAPLFISSSLFMGMKERRFGRIVNISSISAKYGGSSSSLHYGSSKRALEGITKTLAKGGAAFNVLVNTIRPGVIDTAFHKKFPKDMKKRIALIPVGRMGTPGDIAKVAYYLGSDENSFITNEVITVAGGE